ncbi:MAG: hypothetical protein INR71_08850 [Terriglobus roseus]|nr:hypothetical protein [Terriglobus roseus]
MQPALARSIAESVAAILGARSDDLGGGYVSDEAIGAHLWFDRGFRDHDALVQLINLTQEILDKRRPPAVISPPLAKAPQQRKVRH